MINLRLIFVLLGLFLHMASTASAEGLKPFIMGTSIKGNVENAEPVVKSALQNAGFVLVGEYSPYAGAKILVVTNENLKKTAGKSEFGGYGAAIRVSLTEVTDSVQVAWFNPEYMFNIYRMKGNMLAISSALNKALGGAESFGLAEGKSAEDLREYHYKPFMPYFDDPDELEDYDDHISAVAAVENGLAKGISGTKQVYRIDIPGKKQVLFGVAMSKGEGSDQIIMQKIDLNEKRHTAHLPYEILVSGNTIYALGAKFRIALSFPDLSMMGKGSFMDIMSAPGAIENTLEKVAKSNQ